MSDSDGRPDQRPASPAEQPGQAVCPICQGRGFVYVAVPVGDPRFGKAIACTCKRDEIARKRLDSLRRASNLQHLGDMTFATFRTDEYDAPPIALALQDALATARDYAAQPAGWLVFTGSYGCGKTHLAAAIANCRVERGLQTLFVVVPDLLDALRSTYAPGSALSYDEGLEQVRTVQLLILDDLGTQNTTPWAAEKLYQILNYRYAAKLPTVITTNQPLGDLDPRLSSRLGDKSLVRIIPMYAPDHRGSSHGEQDAFGSLNLYVGLTFGNLSDRRDELEPTQAAHLRQAIRTVEQYAENPLNWLVLRGPYGVGKTHLAAAAANKVRNRGGFVLFEVVADLLDDLRATYQPGSNVSFDQRFNDLRRARLLVLDDLGSHSSTPWAQEKLFQILNHRYVAREATIITVSSGDWEQLDERLKTRLLDASVATIVDLNLPEYRGASQPAAPRRTTRRRM